MTCINTAGRKGECFAWGKHLNMVLGRTGLIFCSSQEGRVQDPEVILCHLRSFSKNGEGVDSWLGVVGLPLV